MSDGGQEMLGGAEGGLPNEPAPKQEAKPQPKKCIAGGEFWNSATGEYLIPGPEAEHGGF